MWCCSFGKHFLILWCRANSPSLHIESVFAVLLRESDSFQESRATNSTHFLCSYVAMHFCCIYPILSKCGALYRLFDSGFVRTFLEIDGNHLHTFFLSNFNQYWRLLDRVIYEKIIIVGVDVFYTIVLSRSICG